MSFDAYYDQVINLALNIALRHYFDPFPCPVKVVYLNSAMEESLEALTWTFDQDVLEHSNLIQTEVVDRKNIVVLPVELMWFVVVVVAAVVELEDFVDFVRVSCRYFVQETTAVDLIVELLFVLSFADVVVVVAAIVAAEMLEFIIFKISHREHGKL